MDAKPTLADYEAVITAKVKSNWAKTDSDSQVVFDHLYEEQPGSVYQMLRRVIGTSKHPKAKLTLKYAEQAVRLFANKAQIEANKAKAEISEKTKLRDEAIRELLAITNAETPIEDKRRLVDLMMRASIDPHSDLSSSRQKYRNHLSSVFANEIEALKEMRDSFGRMMAQPGAQTPERQNKFRIGYLRMSSVVRRKEADLVQKIDTLEKLREDVESYVVSTFFTALSDDPIKKPDVTRWDDMLNEKPDECLAMMKDIQAKRAGVEITDGTPKVQRELDRFMQSLVDEFLRLIQARDRHNQASEEKKQRLIADVQWISGMKLVFEKNDTVRLHQVLDELVIKAEDEAKTYVSPMEMAALKQCLRDAQIFVIKHDWAGAFAGSLEDVGQDMRLPYDLCAFEFRISGRTFIMFAANKEVEGQSQIVYSAIHWSQAKQQWLLWREEAWAKHSQAYDSKETPFMFGKRQIQAICVALDTKIASSQVVPAPEKLNKKRLASGKSPLLAYHTVDLSRRLEQASNRASPSEPSGRKVRMHFRRGHWRQYASGPRVWIEWMLVGNPDTGFIQKHYKL